MLAATLILLLVVPVLWTSFFLVAAGVHESLAYDFREAYLPAAEAVLDGNSPYPALDDPRLAAETAYVYPPLLAYALIPFTALSENAASVVAALFAFAVLAGTLVLVGLRDWRCYGAALLWAPSVNALHTASSSLLLAFGGALAWRYRSTVWPLALSVGVAVALKLLIWPLLAWTLVTRRLLATAGALLVAAVLTLVTWGALGFEDIGRYPELLRKLAELEAEESYSLVGAFAAGGLEGTSARILSGAIAVALLVGCALYARRDDDLRSFTCALAAALAFTPILWQHYLVMLLVPLAVARPRFSAIWLVPALLWAAPREDNGSAIQTFLPVLAAAALVVFVLANPGRRSRLAAEGVR
ncbi:MAG: glycosyltransferase family 87 protein [Gaiellaceae bacterium]